MKVMNILVIILVVVVGSLFLFNEKASAAATAVATGDIAIIHSYNEKTKNVEILVYHNPSNSFLLYGYSSKEKEGLKLLHIRRLDNDFDFVKKTEWKLEYEKDGYDVERMKSLIEGR